MKRIKCKVAYDGSMFSGYQVQPNKRTVQSEIQKALMKIHKGEMIKIHGSGRTDAGVHAKGQVFHFDTPLAIPQDRWKVALNSLLPEDISILTAEAADGEFHARFSAHKKEYRYFVQLTKNRDPFKRYYTYQYGYTLDIQAMKEAASALIGTHDFTSFCSAKTEVEDRVRELMEANIILEDDILTFQFIGNGFLYNMVRIITGTLLQVGTGQMKPSDIKEILESKDRSQAGKTAPPQGLYLWEVYY